MDTEELKRDFMRCLLARPTATEAEKIATRMVDDLTDLAKEVAEGVVNEHQESFWHSEDE